MTPEDEENNRKLRERLRAMKQHFPSTAIARQAFTSSRDAMLHLAQRLSSTAGISSLGPEAVHGDLYDESRVGVITGLGDDEWSAIIQVDTDELRDQLANDASFMTALWSAARSGGFAPSAIQIESRQTVDREYRGNWGLRWRA